MESRYCKFKLASVHHSNMHGLLGIAQVNTAEPLVVPVPLIMLDAGFPVQLAIESLFIEENPFSSTHAECRF